jgi:very-short-patch-repair endonuclease
MSSETTYHSPLPKDLLEFARELRRQQTDAEKLLWFLLRGRRLAGFKFRRQYPLEPYVLDFLCFEKKLAIELDGGQHNEPEKQRRDEIRTRFIESTGVQVLRFWNHEVLRDTEVVLQVIWDALQEGPRLSPSPPAPHPEGAGRKEP